MSEATQIGTAAAAMGNGSTPVAMGDVNLGLPVSVSAPEMTVSNVVVPAPGLGAPAPVIAEATAVSIGGQTVSVVSAPVTTADAASLNNETKLLQGEAAIVRKENQILSGNDLILEKLNAMDQKINTIASSSANAMQVCAPQFSIPSPSMMDVKEATLQTCPARGA